MSLNLTELKDEPLGLAPTSADFCVPGTCFVELKDEPLDDSPSVSAMNLCAYCRCDGLGDEALDAQIPLTVSSCMWGVCGFSCLVPDKRAGS